ncbi:unnamed protein product [Clonostachys solani]|uniref:Uncharacterized protein n=1 Tax=Clonostachys solani TaxID=160281 RepID=A0A9P0EPU4_9HYPO|nr:unnamed protein product [Clonostachys solani]
MTFHMPVGSDGHPPQNSGSAAENPRQSIRGRGLQTRYSEVKCRIRLEELHGDEIGHGRYSALAPASLSTSDDVRQAELFHVWVNTATKCFQFYLSSGGFQKGHLHPASDSLESARHQAGKYPLGY